ncbi:MAG: hypothetical protein M3O66_05390 [Verrucomicrobiota bacterium]|nr:hypothetical protein [Verrucomicrobiota bacterium]
MSPKEVEPEELPLRSVWNDEDYKRRNEALLSGTHASSEIEEFAQEFVKKYSDPADKAEVLYAVAFAYSANQQFLSGLKVVRKKMELFGADVSDYLLTAAMLEGVNDVDGMKREFRAGVMFGVRSIPKKQSYERRATAKAIGEMFDKLQERQDAAQWFDVSLMPDWWNANIATELTAEWAENLPKWYQSERAARGKNETNVARLVTDNPESYLNSIRNRWLSQNETEIVSLMRSWGLAEERAKQILKMGIDSLSSSWWEQEVRPRLTQDQWVALRTKLDERKSL